MSGFAIQEARLLLHPGDNPQGKFYFSALIHDLDEVNEDAYYVVNNWGVGNGTTSVMHQFGDAGQCQALGPFATMSAARTQMNRKLTAKLDAGYNIETVRCDTLGGKAQLALIGKRGRGVTSTDVASNPVAPPVPDNTAMLLGLALTPENILRIATHRQVLAMRTQDLRREIAGIEAEAEALSMRLSAIQ